MKRKILSCVLTICMILTMVPWTAAAESTTKELDISKGSIVITADGYTQGEGTEIEHIGEYKITGTATTANTITVEGGNPTITFSGLNIKRNNEVSSKTPVLTVNNDATIKLDGSNMIDSTEARDNKENIRTNIITIGASATLTVDGSGSLDIAAGLIHANNGYSPVKGEGTFKMVNGTVNISSSGTNPALGCDYAELNGGSLKLNATSHSTSKALVVKELTVGGGALDVTGNAAGVEVKDFNMSGGIISKIKVKDGNPVFTAENANITGGNVNGYYNGAVNGRTLTTLQVNGDDYLLLRDTVIEVDEYDKNGDKIGTFKATTNGSGLVYTYLNNDTTALKYKGVDYNVTPGTEVVIGPKLSGKTFNIGAGAITVEEGSDGKAKYTQGGAVYEAASNEKVYIVGSGDTSNYLEVKSGTANVILHNVKINNTGGSSDDANGFIRVTSGTLNLMIEGENKLTKARGNVIFVGSVTDPTDPDAAVLNIDCPEGANCSEETCQHSLNLEVTDRGLARSAILGGARDYDVDGDGTVEDDEKQVDMAGTININGGKVIINGGSTGIGTPNAMAVYHYDVNITDGYVDVTTNSGADTVGIGTGRKGLDGTVMNINIIDGTVKVTNPGVATDANANVPVAIGAGYDTHGKVNIKIGGENTDPKVTATCENGIAIGKGGSMTSTSGTGTTMDIDIVSGDVTATGSVGIGYTTAANETEEGNTISISGGKVTANGTKVGIGISVANPKLDGTINKHDSCGLEIDIAGDAEVDVTGGAVAIGADEMVSGGNLDIAVSGSANVKVTATSENGIGIGATKDSQATEDYTTKTTIAITSPNVTIDAKIPVAAATDGTLAAESIYTFETKDGSVTVKVSDGEAATVGADGTIELPAGTVVEKPDGTTVTLPDGATLKAEGTIETEGSIITEKTDGTVEVKDADGNVTTITPPAGEDVEVKPNGDIELPEGTTLTESEGEQQTTVTVPSGGTLKAGGTVESEGTVITEKADGTVEVKDADENVTTITPPEGEDVKVNSDGTIELPEGSTLTEGEGDQKTTVTVPDGGTLDADGNVETEGSIITEKADGTVITEKADGTVVAEYVITHGKNSVWNGSKDGLTITGTGDFDKFKEVKVDGVVIDKTHYTAKSGSTIVTLKGSYLDTLSAGNHTIELAWSDGTASTTFTIAKAVDKSSDTGDSSRAPFAAAGLVLAAMAAVITTRRRYN